MKSLYQPLYLFIRKRVRSSEDAEDLTQDVFLKASVADFTKIEQLRAWLFQIARNTLIDYYRKNSRDFPLKDLEGYLYPEGEENSIFELSECVKAFVQQLPEEDCMILTQVEFEKKSQKEVALTLGINYTSLKSKVQRAREKLKPMLQSCCQDGKSCCGVNDCNCS